MKLVIEIGLNNAAFKDGGAEEVARILADLGEHLPDPLGATRAPIKWLLRDSNGKRCGQAEIVAD